MRHAPSGEAATAHARVNSIPLSKGSPTVPARRRSQPSLLDRIRRRMPALSAPASPLELLDDAPLIVGHELKGRTVTGLPPSPPPKQHWMYQVDQDAVLHV
jgi:hypothetical protein